jgi:FKBP-type peptidyl-prolyl cis-trans isomerase SlyD
MANESGETKTFFVTEIKNGKLTVDGNHPLAGKAITFHVEVKSIRDATAEEIRNGRPDEGMPEGILH